MKAKLTVISFSLLALSMVSVQNVDAKTWTTNDVDSLFSLSGNESISAIRRRCWDAEIRKLDSSQADIRAYVFDKVLKISVETNMPGFAYRLGEKASWIEKSCKSVGILLGDAEIRKVLDSAFATRPIATNDLMRLREKAIQRDTEKWGRAVNYVGTPYENFGRWRRTCEIVKSWNKAVADYRRRLVAFACRKYDELYKDAPEAERREALRALLRERGLQMPED